MHIIRMILSLGLCNAFEPQPKSVLRQRTEQTTCQERSRSCKALPAAARSGHGAGSRIEMSFAFVYRCCQLLSVCCSKNVPKSLQDFQIVEQTRGDPDIGEQHGAGAGLDEDGTWVHVLLSAKRSEMAWI